jgi:hypothetical protein
MIVESIATIPFILDDLEGVSDASLAFDCGGGLLHG